VIQIPVSNELFIENEKNPGIIPFQLINGSEEVVYNGTLLKETIIKTIHFTPGIYLIKILKGKKR
jgi:hypothetical protein